MLQRAVHAPVGSGCKREALARVRTYRKRWTMWQLPTRLLGADQLAPAGAKPEGLQSLENGLLESASLITDGVAGVSQRRCSVTAFMRLPLLSRRVLTNQKEKKKKPSMSQCSRKWTFRWLNRDISGLRPNGNADEGVLS